MRLKIFILLTLILLGTPFALADSTSGVSSEPTAPVGTNDWTVAGKVYHNVKVGTVEADRVHITYDGGIGTVPLADLPPDLQKRFNYDPVAAKAMTHQREQQATQSDAEAYAVQAQNDKQEAQQELTAASANTSQRAELEKQIKACTEALRYDQKSVYGQSWNATDKARAEAKVAVDQTKLAALQAKLANMPPQQVLGN